MKNILPFIFSLLLLVACDKRDSQLDYNAELERTAIALKVKTDASGATRAEADLLRTPSEVGSIGLYIYVERPNGVVEVLAENVKLNYVEGETLWEYDNPALAPEWGYTDGSDRYTFYGYAPYRADGRGISFDADKGEFSMDYSMSDNQDLMIAETRGIVCPAGGVVALNLKHTLSAVSLNTTYSSVITKVELVTSDSGYTNLPISGRVSFTESGDVEWGALEYLSAPERYKLSNESRTYMLLLPYRVVAKGDLFFSITSVKNNKVIVDENAKIPAMTLASSGVYKFNYKEPYFDVDEDGDLVIDVGKIMDDTDVWNDYTAIDELIEKLKEKGHTTVKVTGTPSSPSDAYHIINHILQNGGMDGYDLSGYIIPEGTTLPYNLFQKNTTLKSLIMPVLRDGYMLDNSFWGCTSLESVVFPEGQKITSLPNSAFKGCASLTSVKLDMSSDLLTSIGQDVFNGCTALKSMEIPRSVESIGYGAFSGCSQLKSINIPASVTDIGGQAFLNCSSLYSYGEDSGIVFEDRSAQSTPITVGWKGFVGTHVRPIDIPSDYIHSDTDGNGYFSEF